jgi:phenylacetate-CoA ligase
MTAPDRHPETERLYWPAGQIRAYQLERLRATVAQAARAPYYASRLAGARVDILEDLARLPLTSKEDARAASPLGLLAVPSEELFAYHESYGTTGPPTSSWLTCDDFHNYAQQINHAAVGFRPGDRVAVRFPYAISVPAHIVTQAARDRGACVIPISSRTTVSPYGRVIDLLRKLEATVLACLPTEAFWLGEAARQKGLEPGRDFPRLRALAVAGELLSDARRERLAGLWNARVYNLYGCTEAGNMAADCEAGRLHLSWDHFLVEVLDEAAGTPVAPGQFGTAVVTTLTRTAMPLVRFVLGDRVRLRDGTGCPCGRTAPVLEHYGRDLNWFECGGRTYFVRDLEERLLRTPVESVGNFWLLEMGPDSVRFRVEAARPDPALYRRLEEQVRNELGLALVFDATAPGGLLDRARFRHIEPVAKPRVVGKAPVPGAAPLTLDDLV